MAIRWQRFILLALVVAIALTGVFTRDLWTPDEARVTAIAIEMEESGDIVIPRLAGVPFLQKPPLYFLTGAAAIRAFDGQFSAGGAVRFTSALWGLGVLLLTALLAHRLTDDRRAWVAALVLGTSLGFVENQHWIRVDAALAFFVVAAIWAFAEAYAGERSGWVIVGGLMTAGAFLSKGVIGPLLIFPGWAALLWVYTLRGRPLREWRLRPGVHLLAGFVCVAASGFWLVLLRWVGGPELWHEWFWENQVGRTTGQSEMLGHMYPGRPDYYLGYVALYCLPWTPFVAVWLWRRAVDMVGGDRMEAGRLALLLWAAASVILLTIPTTKRSVYLLPVLPAFALIIADTVLEKWPMWSRRYALGWRWLAVGILALLGLAPIWAPPFGGELRPAALELLTTWGGLQVTMLLLAAIGAAANLGRWWGEIERTVLVSALLLYGIWLFPARVIDEQKSLRADVVAFVESVPAEEWPRVAGWNLTETMRGCLVVYSDLAVRSIRDRERAADILAGRDPEYDALLVSDRLGIDGLEGLEWRVVATGRPGSRRLRLLQPPTP